MSASFIWIAWCSPIGLPIVRRSCAYASARVERGARDADRARRDVDAPHLERAEDVARGRGPASPTRAVGGDAVPVVLHLDRLDALVPELADVAAHGDAAEPRAGLLLDDEARDALVGARRERDDRRRARRSSPTSSSR